MVSHHARRAHRLVAGVTAEIHSLSGRVLPHATENAGEAPSSSRTSPATLYATPSPTRHKPWADISSYGLFLLNYDTAEIAARLCLPENVVHKRITLARDTENGTQTFFERLDP